MRTSSMLTRQVSGGGGRGVCGARKLIPMPLRISRAPECPRAQRIFVRAPPKHPPRRPARICTRSATSGRPWPFYESGALK